MKKLTLTVALSVLAAVPTSAGVLQRGTLNCGTDNTAPEFGYPFHAAKT